MSSGYIWVNYNISLTWINAIWGWFPLSTMIPVRSQWGRYNLPIYIYIDAFNDTISSGRRFMFSVPISVSKKNLAFWDVQRVPFPVRQGQAVPCPPAWTSSPRPSGSPAHTSPRNKNQGEDYCELMCVQCTGRYVYIYIWIYVYT